jgi:hypothetical protein
MMSSKDEKCPELVFLDGSNYESWCMTILHDIEVFNPYLLSIVNSSICPPNINWANISKEERKCLELTAQALCLLTQSLSPSVEASMLKEHGLQCSLAVEIYQRKVFRVHSSTRLKRCSLSDQTGQTGWTNRSDWYS